MTFVQGVCFLQNLLRANHMHDTTIIDRRPLRGYRRVLIGIFFAGRRAEMHDDQERTYKRPDFNFWYELGRQDARNMYMATRLGIGEGKYA